MRRPCGQRDQHRLHDIRQRTGHAIIGTEQWIQKEHVSDTATAAAMGLPEDLTFKTKGQIAARLVQKANSDGVSADFVTGDEVYGTSPDLREYCEKNGQGYVLRVAKPSTSTSTRRPP